MSAGIEYGEDEVIHAGNREAEIAILGACFNSPISRKRVRALLAAGDFYWPEHAETWEAMERLEHHKKAIGAPSLIEMLKTNRAAMALLPDMATNYATPEEVESYASIVHGLAVRRRTASELMGALAQVRSSNVNAEGFLAGLVTNFTRLRDSGSSQRVDALTLRELLDTEDEPHDWLIPNLLERGDRFMLTGEEGMGKSVFLRQIAVCAAAGLHPFGGGRIEPIKALIIDAENSERQVRRGMRQLAAQVGARGRRDPRDFVMVECNGRMDITSDLTLSRLHQTLDAMLPDIIVIGPLYRLTPRAIQTDDEAAVVLAALDTIKDRGIALLIEAHAGHSQGATGSRNMRPRGSSALMGWPEFGYGLASDKDSPGKYVLKRWRGDRDERMWPNHLERGRALPWSPSEQQVVNWGIAEDERRRLA
jgi:hypothetical protein